MDTKELNINIFGRDLKLKCKVGEAETLLAATKILNEKLIEISNKSNIKNLEMLSIMASLNIIHESMMSAESEDLVLHNEYKIRLENMTQEIDKALMR